MYKIYFAFFTGFTLLLSACSSKSYLFVGTYTQEDKSGIHTYQFNESNGVLQHLSKTENIANPSYLAFSKNKKFIYSVNEDAPQTGGVSAFSINTKTGALQLINQQNTANALAPCYISIDGSGKYAAVANYVSGNFHIYPLNADGTVQPAIQAIQLEKETQEKSHAHQTIFSADNRFLFVTDLGTNTLYQFTFDAASPEPVLSNPKIYKVPAGYGPRHLVISPNNKHLYLLNEWEGNIFVYNIHNDILSFVQEIASATIVNPDNKNKGSAAIKISPDGKFLYASNRGITNNIAIYKIEKDGTLNRVGEQKTDNHPRDFIITKSGKYLLVAARDSNSIKTYLRDKQTGLLTYTGLETKLSMPVMLLEY